MDAYEVLVIILSVALAIFLILAIAAIIITIVVLKKIKDVANKAQQITQNIESFSASMLKTKGLVNFVRAIYSLINSKSR